MSKQFKIALVILTPLVLAVAMYIPYSPGGRQFINMQVAKDCLPRIKAVCEGDERFRNVQVAVYTGQDGAIGLAGSVATDEDLFLLMKAVAKERLPVPVAWLVEVRPAIERRKS